MKIITAIASTTHLDLHNERMAKSSLEGNAEQIKSKFIPFLVNHDHNQQIGVILYGKVLPMEDGEFALCVVCGIFEDENEYGLYKIGSKNSVWREYEHYYMEPMIIKNVAPSKLTQSNNKSDDLADLLEMHLDSTKILPDGRVCKIKHFISSIGDLKISVYPKDHLPAHFHIFSRQRGIDARFDIETLELLSVKKGKVSADDIKKVRSFFKAKPNALNKLRSEYKRINPSD